MIIWCGWIIDERSDPPDPAMPFAVYREGQEPVAWAQKRDTAIHIAQKLCGCPKCTQKGKLRRRRWDELQTEPIRTMCLLGRNKEVHKRWVDFLKYGGAPPDVGRPGRERAFLEYLVKNVRRASYE